MSNTNFEYLSPQPLHEGIYAAADFINRQTIEIEAQQLIEQLSHQLTIEVEHQERQDNARTALMEALTASGHLSVVEIKGSFEEINAQVLSRLLGGWDESLPTHEKNRRFAELCNELIIQKIQAAILEGILPADTEVCEISDYPEALRGHSLGYRDTNNKGMIRSTRLHHNGAGQYSRVIETVSRSNSASTSTFSFLADCDIETQNKPGDIAALETPLIYTKRDYTSGVIDIMRKLDQYSGSGTRYGDSGERANKHPTYDKLRKESARREQEILCFVDDLAKLEEQLDRLASEGRLPKHERLQIFKEEVDRILSAICTLEPNYAEDTFGRSSALVFRQAAILEAQGRHMAAQSLLESNNHLKETVTFCGMSISVEKAREMGLQVNSLGQLLEKGKKGWKWKQGVCVVKSCPTRPGKTKVGPCSVCADCQSMFDNGRNPTKFTAAKTNSSKNKAVKLALAA